VPVNLKAVHQTFESFLDQGQAIVITLLGPAFFGFIFYWRGHPPKTFQEATELSEPFARSGKGRLVLRLRRPEQSGFSPDTQMLRYGRSGR